MTTTEPTVVAPPPAPTAPSYRQTTVPMLLAATRVRWHEPLYLPGPLQIPDYTTAVLQGLPGWTPEDVAQMTAHRWELRQHLRRRARLEVVIGEAVLRYVVGDAGVMARQLGALAESSLDGNINLRVVPTGVLYLKATSDYAIVTTGTAEIVNLEHLLGCLVSEQTSDLVFAKAAFDAAQAAALTVEGSRALIRRYAEDYANG